MDRTGRPVRMLDVADSLGLSRATVSLVMRNSPLVAEATKQAVLAEADRLGYVYHRGAANLRTQRSDVVGLVMPDVINPFVAEISIGAQDVLENKGFFPMIANTRDSLEAQRHVIRTLVEQRVAGLIIIPVLAMSDAQTEDLRRSNVPIVLLTRDLTGSGLPFVGPDDRAVGRVGARHLLADHDCRTVAYFSGNAVAGPRITREQGFRRAVGSRAKIIPAWNEPFDATSGLAYRTASRLLQEGPPPEGMLCHSDAVAFGLLRALYEHGIGPDQCRVLGIDDLGHSAARIPSLSTVAVQPIELGRISAEVLLQQLGFADIDPGKPPAPKVVARESCGCVPLPAAGHRRRAGQPRRRAGH
jgi:LacI family transcriptional regulator